MTEIRLHSFFRSSTSVRVRVALALKGLAYDYVGHDIRQSSSPDMQGYRELNPQGLVPALEIDGQLLLQSVPIIEYLDERFPQNPLLPSDALGRARVRGLAAMIACEVHPLNNLRVLRHIATTFGADSDAQANWFRHWATTTLDPLEQMLASSHETGRFCHGDSPGLADICLFAQMINNQRFDLSAERWPVLARIFGNCLDLPAFQAALPSAQPDAV